MTARVVTPWVVGEGGSGGDPGPCSHWRVWVEEAGRFRFAGTFAGSESEAIAAALDATGSERGFAVEAGWLLSTQTTGPPRRRKARVQISDRRSP